MSANLSDHAADVANEALDYLCAQELPLSVREYMLAHSSEIVHKYFPDQNSVKPLKQGATDLVNRFMHDLYHGSITSEQCLASGNKEFLQNPAMLSYWAKSKGFPTIAQNNTSRATNGMVLTYYPPLAKSYSKRIKGEVSDISNKHFYSHCKSSFYGNNKSVIVLNPELNENSNISERTYAPKDAILYNIDYQRLGLSPDAVQEGFRYMEADINIMDPQVQNKIFSLKDQGLSTDEIITQCRGKYHYNLQEYNCAVKPVAPLIFANEAKIHGQQKQNKNYDANACRRNLGLPNIYDPARYGKINQNFYAGYMKNAQQNFSNTMRASLRDTMKNSAKTANTALKVLSPSYGVSSLITEHATAYVPTVRKQAKRAEAAFSRAYTKGKKEIKRRARQAINVGKGVFSYIFGNGNSK